jgi:beta-catenin-like protein 1
MANALPELLMSNISRFSPTEPAEQQGLYHTLGLVENLLSSSQAQAAATAFLDKSKLLVWLLKSIQPPGKLDDAVVAAGEEANRFYAAELLAILLSLPNVSAAAQANFIKEQGTDAILKCLSVYRKRDPRGEEVEYMENLFDCLCSVLSGGEEGKKTFREAEGPELMIILMKCVVALRLGVADGCAREKKMAKTRSIKVLDFAMSAEGEGAETCLQFVDSLGLKTLFPAFMGKVRLLRDRELS